LGGSAAEHGNDGVLLIQQRASEERVPVSPELEEDDELFSGLHAALTVEDAVRGRIAPMFERSLARVALFGTGEPRLAAPGESNCTQEERTHFNASIVTSLAGKGFPRAECPKGLNPLIGDTYRVCVRKILNLSDECTACHVNLAKSLPACYGKCQSVIDCNRTANVTVGMPQECMTKLGDCMQCTAPPVENHLRCTGNSGRSVSRVIQRYSTQFSDGNTLELGKMANFVNQITAVFR